MMISFIFATFILQYGAVLVNHAYIKNGKTEVKTAFTISLLYLHQVLSHSEDALLLFGYIIIEAVRSEGEEAVFMTAAFLLSAVIGALLVVFGVDHIKAPFSWYNRANIAEENKTVFGKRMGTAQIIGGTGILLFCVMGILSISGIKPDLWTAGMYLMIVMLAAAICIYIVTLIKYYQKIS